MLKPAQARHLATLFLHAGSARFPRLLIALCRRGFDCNTVAVMVFSEAPEARILDSWVEDPALDRVFRDVYARGVFRLDPFYQARNHCRRPEFLRLRDIAPDRFFTSEYFRRYYSLTAFTDEMGFLMPFDPGASLHLSISRRGTDRRFSPSERRWLEAMAPVLGALLIRHYGREELPREAPEPVAPLSQRIEAHARHTFLADLTRREALVLQHVLEGYSNTAIGLLIDVSPLTVKVHRRNAYRKLGISTQAELFAAFIPALTGTLGGREVTGATPW